MKTLILSLFLFLTIGCNRDETQSVTNVATPITPTLIGKSSISNPNTSLQNVLITNQTQWNSLLTSMNAVNNVSNNFTEINIDFINFDIIAVFRNPISNSSSTVDIITIVENQTNRVVTVQNLTNGISSDVAQPFHIVKVPKSTKPVVFQ
jgi:LAS superfamily LD-carboxypeptidase LdcB